MLPVASSIELTGVVTWSGTVLALILKTSENSDQPQKFLALTLSWYVTPGWTSVVAL